MRTRFHKAKIVLRTSIHDTQWPIAEYSTFAMTRSAPAARHVIAMTNTMYFSVIVPHEFLL